MSIKNSGGSWIIANTKNYRPVSLTSLTSKVMEHIDVVSFHISRHLSTNRIVSQHQQSFRRGLSCETQLRSSPSYTDDVHGPVDAVILDFAKAFDSGPHERLLLKADYYRYRRKSNIRLQSFVTGRSQRFVVNGSASSWSPVVFGVPQGTLLRSILFLMSMNDLATNITPSIKLFATTVFFTVWLIPLAIMLLSTARPRSTREVGLDMADEICSYKMFCAVHYFEDFSVPD